MNWDLTLSALVRSGQLAGDLRRGLGLCEAFAHSFGVLLIVACLWCAGLPLRARLLRVVACAFLPGVVANVLKLAVVRWRPLSFDSPPIDAWTTWAGIGERFTSEVALDSYLTQSFPSGHAATGFGFAVGLSWLFPRGRAMFLALAVLASLQRVVSAAHWPSDTLAGAAIAFAVSGWLVTDSRAGRWFDWWEQRWRDRALAEDLPGEQRRAA